MPAELAMSIDFKHHRMRIHKKTLHAMGNPEYVQVLVAPEERALAIMPCGRSNPRSHRLHWERLANGQSFELHSKSLVRNLFELRGDWQGGHTYRIRGAFAAPNRGVVFNMAESTRV